MECVGEDVEGIKLVMISRWFEVVLDVGKLEFGDRCLMEGGFIL